MTFSGLLSKDFCMVGRIRSLNSVWDMNRSKGAQLSYEDKESSTRASRERE